MARKSNPKQSMRSVVGPGPPSDNEYNADEVPEDGEEDDGGNAQHPPAPVTQPYYVHAREGVAEPDLRLLALLGSGLTKPGRTQGTD
jgi:hypothetical protein